MNEELLLWGHLKTSLWKATRFENKITCNKILHWLCPKCGVTWNVFNQMKFLIALLKLGSVERMEDTCLKKIFFTHFHFDVKGNFFLLKILSAGSEPTVFHWQINGDPKTHVPCTPNSVFTMQINDQSPKNKVAKNSSSVWPQLFKRLDNAIYWIYQYICNHLCIR